MSEQGSRVILLTRDGLYARLFYKSFISKYPGKLAGIVLSSSFLHRGTPSLIDLTRYIRRVGISYAIYQAWVSCPVSLFCMRFQGIRKIAKQEGIPVLVTNDINSQVSKAWVASHEADFLLSFHFNQRIGNEVITLARRAAINFHPSLLPGYRGVDPVLFGLADRQSVIGASLHLLTERLDEGDILLQASYPVQTNNIIRRNSLLFSNGGELASNVINDFELYYHARLAQDCSNHQYYGWDKVRHVSLWRKCWR